MTHAAPWPTELRLKEKGAILRVLFNDAEDYELSAEYLRVYSPSAEVRGHGPRERKIIGGKRQVRISAVEPVGNYAVKLVFDDAHATGLYSWTYLAELGREHVERWSGYLALLAAKGLDRDTPGEKFEIDP